MVQKYVLHYQSCAITNRLRNNRFLRRQIRKLVRKLVSAINISDIGLVLKQINTETR